MLYAHFPPHYTPSVVDQKLRQPKKNDTEAMDAIHELLNATEWDVETVEWIAIQVELTGRKIDPPEDMPDEWIPS